MAKQETASTMDQFLQGTLIYFGRVLRLIVAINIQECDPSQHWWEENGY